MVRQLIVDIEKEIRKYGLSCEIFTNNGVSISVKIDNPNVMWCGIYDYCDYLNIQFVLVNDNYDYEECGYYTDRIHHKGYWVKKINISNNPNVINTIIDDLKIINFVNIKSSRR